MRARLIPFAALGLRAALAAGGAAAAALPRAAPAQAGDRFDAELRGPIARRLTGEARFESVQPEMSSIRLIDYDTDGGIFSVTLDHPGPEMPAAGSYPIVMAAVSSDMPPAGTFRAYVQLPVRMVPDCGVLYPADTAEGRVWIEAADTVVERGRPAVATRGRFEVKLSRRGLPRLPAACDTVRVTARFRARYDDSQAQLIRRMRAAGNARSAQDTAPGRARREPGAPPS